MPNLKTQDFIPGNHKLLWFEQKLCVSSTIHVLHYSASKSMKNWYARFCSNTSPKFIIEPRPTSSSSIQSHPILAEWKFGKRLDFHRLLVQVSMGSGNQMTSRVHNQICHRSWCGCSLSTTWGFPLRRGMCVGRFKFIAEREHRLFRRILVENFLSVIQIAADE